MIQAECGVVSKGGLEPLQRPKQMLTVRAAPVRRGQKKMVSKGGLEPPRPNGRQPLKLVRLPIPPLRRGNVRLATN